MLTVREAVCADAAGIARVHVESWRTTYPGIVPDDVLARLSVEPRERYWGRLLCEGQGVEFVYVAENEAGEVVGFASGGPERTGDPVFVGELPAIYLLQEYQRQGAGGRLLAAVAARLRTMGMPAMLLWVLEENRPARRFYEGLGGDHVREQPIEIGGVTLTEVAYGWRDTSVLRQEGEPR